LLEKINLDMKKHVSIFLFAGFCVLLTACRKEPKATLTLSTENPTVNEVVVVTCNSDDANAFTWSAYNTSNPTSTSNVTLQAGGQICDKSTIYSFDSVGTYTIKVKAHNYKNKCDSPTNSGYSTEVTKTITVN
jgi:hypothetical protein